jgi:hypothetical protein
MTTAKKSTTPIAKMKMMKKFRMRRLLATAIVTTIARIVTRMNLPRRRSERLPPRRVLLLARTRRSSPRRFKSK